jgi:hypothetical protein
MTLLCISERGVIFALFFEPEKLSAMQDSGPKLRPEINENEIMKSVLVAIKDSFLGAFEEILESIKASLHALRTSFPEVDIRNNIHVRLLTLISTSPSITSTPCSLTGGS